MPQAQTIAQQTGFPAWIDFEFLRKKGLKHIGELSGDWWTDHNTHDPGITIMEVLCYALTDLGYRTQLDTKNILARPYQEATDNNFFTPDEILTCNPLTLQDYKKILLDIEGIRNAWLFPIEDCAAFRGLYNVYIDIEDFIENGSFGKSNLTKESVLAEATKILQAHRSLGEDFNSITIVAQEKLPICMDLDLTATAIPEDVIVEVFLRIQAFLTPHIPFYTLQELMQKGKTIEEIFAGRPLIPNSHGFIDNDDLEKLAPKAQLHISDLYKIIMEVEGVRAVTQLSVNCKTWCLDLDITKSPCIDIDCFVVNITKGNNLPLYENRINWVEIRQKLRHRLANFNKVSRNKYELGSALTQEEYLDLANYTSIMEEFPVTYGVGTGHTPMEENMLDLKHHAFQLKGYLSFYDQLLINYLGQFAGLRQLLRMYSDNPAEQGQSYLTQSLAEVMPMAEDILKNANGLDPLALKLPIAKLSKRVGSKSERDNIIALFQKGFNDNTLIFKIVDVQEKHPKVKDCYRFYYTIDIEGTDYQIVSFDYKKDNCNLPECFGVYETEAEAKKEFEKLQFLGIFEQAYSNVDKNFEPDEEPSYGFHIIDNPLSYTGFLQSINETKSNSLQRREEFLDHLLGRFSEQFTEYSLLMYARYGKKKPQIQEMIEDKERFLKNYPSTSRNRAKGFDYSNENERWNTLNTSGFEQRVAGYMGIDEWQRRNLNTFKLVNSSTSYFQQWKDEFGNILLETAHFFDENQLIEAIKKIETAAVFNDINCYSEGFYSFEITDGCGNLLAIHPQRYDTEMRRDEMRDYFKILLWEQKVTSKQIVAVAYKYQLCNEKEELLLQSIQEFSDEATAKKAFYQMLAYAVFDKNYSLVKKRKNYTFALKNAVGEEIAISKIYEDAGERDVYKSNTINYLQKYWLPFEVAQTAKYCTWQMQNAQGESFAKSVHNFANCDDSAAAYTEAMRLAQNPKNWSVIMDDKTNEWHLGLWRTDEKQQLFLDWLPKTRTLLARSVACFSSNKAADDALLLLEQNVENETQWLDILFKNTKIQTFGFQWIVPSEGAILMQNKHFYKTEKEAIRAYDFSLKLLADAKKYQIKKGTDDLFRLEIIDYDNTIWLLSEAEFTREEDAKTAISVYTKIAQETALQRDILTQHEGKYFAKIVNPESGETILQSVEYFDNEAVAYDFTVILSEVISNEKNFKRTTETLSDGTILYGFELEKEGKILAKHPEQYEKEQQLKENLSCLLAFEQVVEPKFEAILHEKTVYISHNCDLTLRESEIFVKKEVQKTKESILMPQDYEDICSESIGNESRIRMSDATNFFATYSKSFLSEDDRNEEEKAFVNYWKSADKIFTEVVNLQAVSSYGTDISEVPKDFCKPPKDKKKQNYFAFDFYVKCKNDEVFSCPEAANEPIGKIGLRSVKVFDTSEEALEYGDENLVYFMSLLQNYDAYEILKCPSETGCYFLQVFDYQLDKENPVLVSSRYPKKDKPKEYLSFEKDKPKECLSFKSEKCARIAMKNLIDWATRFPIKQLEKDAFEFQLLIDGVAMQKIKGEGSMVNRFWISTNTYKTWQAAYDGFYEMLRLLDYTPNIFRLKAPFSLALGEILLETPETVVAKDEISSEKTWSNLTYHLERFNREKHLHIFPTEDCACEIVLGSDCYRLAFHPYVYDNPIQRTRAWQQWWKKVHCSNFSKPQLLDIKVVKIKDLTYNIVEFSTNGKNYKLKFSVNQAWYDIQKYAEFPEFYDIEPYTFKENKVEKTIFRLTLKDENDQQTAVFLQANDDDCFDSIAECEAIIKAFVIKARLHPIKKGADGKFFFRVYDTEWTKIKGAKASLWDLPDSYDVNENKCHNADNQPVIKIEGAYIWQEIMRCSAIEKVEEHYKRFCESIKEKGNYKYVKDADCGPFSLELVDKNEAWAYYPLRIKSTQKAKETADKIWNTINREGFHVVEHILLREAVNPRQICCDAISGIVTIVLPHWSERFQNEQFRSFFQATISRELPAHLAPQIFWVTPEGMAKFEQKYYQWLFQQDEKNSLELREVINDLKNFMPNSTLETKNVNTIFLDESVIN